jgi:hypothetical protein
MCKLLLKPSITDDRSYMNELNLAVGDRGKGRIREAVGVKL